MVWDVSSTKDLERFSLVGLEEVLERCSISHPIGEMGATSGMFRVLAVQDMFHEQQKQSKTSDPG